MTVDEAKWDDAEKNWKPGVTVSSGSKDAKAGFRTFGADFTTLCKMSVCKRRHVKCDETLPQCVACIKRSLRCDYLDGAPLALLSGKRRALLPTPGGGGHPPPGEAPAEATAHGVVNASICSANLPRRWEPLPYPAICTQIGGFRNDPFSAFPVESKSYLASAYGYYATVYMPSAFRMANITGDIPFFYSSILHDAMQFDALIALVLTVQRMHLARKDRMSHTILQHMSRATTGLRERLLSGKDVTSDAVFCTMFRLLVVQHLLGNLQTYEIHVNGLKQLVNLCGGVESLHGLRGYVKDTVIKTFATWSTFERSRDTDSPNAKSKQELTYPEHPYPADVCFKLTAFPSGFRELAVSGKLSVQCIHFVHLIVLTLSKKSYDVLSLVSGELLGQRGLTTLERLLASTLSAYNVLMCSETRVASPWPAWSMYLDQQIERSVSSPDLDACDPDFMDWTCLMLRATTQTDAMSWRWADTRLQGKSVSDDRREALGSAFIPIPRGASFLISSPKSDAGAGSTALGREKP